MDVELQGLQTTFEGIVGKSVFVDKSKMIKTILSGPRYIHITAPPLFGKTTNMDMLRKFFEMTIEDGQNIPRETTYNYSIFASNNLDIFRDHESMEHFGKYLVIYLDCKCTINLHNYSNIEQFCLKVIHNAYKQHEYLGYSNRVPDKEIVNDWCDTYLWTLNPKCNVRTGLRILLLSLMKHHEPTPDIMVLVDDLDSPLVNLVRNQRCNWPTVRKTYYQYRDLYFSMLDPVTKFEHRMRVILSGTFRTESPFVYQDQHQYDFLLDETYTPFYGATSIEVKKLLDKFGVPSDIKSEVRLYFGRYYSKHGSYEMYDLHGVLLFLQQYLKGGNLDFVFSTLNLDVNLQPSLNNLQVQGILWLLKAGHKVICNYYVSLVTVESFLETVPYLKNINTLSINHKARFPFYLLQLGYVSYTTKAAVSWLLDNYCCALCQFNDGIKYAGNVDPRKYPGPCWVKVPNIRAFVQLEKLLFNYYWRTFSFSKENIAQCGRLLHALGPSATGDEFAHFRDELSRLFQTNYFIQENPSAFLAFYPVACFTLRDWEVYPGRDMYSKYIFLIRNDFEISMSICIHTDDENADAALATAHTSKRTNLRRVNPIMQIVCIGINVVTAARGVQGVRVDMKCELAEYAGPSSPYRTTPLYAS